MISRQDALQFLNEKIENKNIIKHMLATEAMMLALARRLGGDEEKWRLVGLLHDGDYIPTVPENRQGLEVTEMLRRQGFEIPEDVARAMAAHNHMTGCNPVTAMDWAIFCGDSLTGLIVAATLVLPSRKLADLTVANVLNRFKEKSFARGTRREDIALCQEKLGIPLPEFIEISLKAMQNISRELGL